MFDAAHRAASAEVKQISQEFLAEKGITPQRPMTLAESTELLERVRFSQTPALTAYRNALADYMINFRRLGIDEDFEFRFEPPEGR